jgi:hypothetical protein
MICKTTQYVLWAIGIVVLLLLAQTGHRTELGIAITAIAVFWFVIVPETRSGRQ